MFTLTAQSRAIAAFTLSVLLVTGSLSRFTYALIGIAGQTFPSGDGGALITGLIAIAIGTAVLVLAASARSQLGDGWESNLAQAAMLLAVIGIGLAVLSTVNSVAHDTQFGFYAFQGGTALVG